MTPARRRAAYRLGLSAELKAALWLRLKGYRILARRFRCPAGEVDIVARRGRTLCFVEVKARADREAAALSLLPRQRMRILRAAEAFLARNPRYGDHAVRFDAVLVARGRLPRHEADYFRA